MKILKISENKFRLIIRRIKGVAKSRNHLPMKSAISVMASTEISHNSLAVNEGFLPELSSSTDKTLWTPVVIITLINMK
jgi:hypothetical protein